MSKAPHSGTLQNFMTPYGKPLTYAIFCGVVFFSGLGFWWVAGGTFPPCSPTLQSIEKYAKTFAALDGIVDVGLKLSTTLAGLGAAVLVGLKTELVLTRPIRLIVLIATLLFAQSAFYAVWWRLGLAEIWLSECLDLVTADKYQNRFQAHFMFFFCGLTTFGIVAIGAALFPPRTK